MMEQIIKARFVVRGTEFDLMYVSRHEGSFLNAAGKLREAAIEMDVLIEIIEPQGAEALKLLAQAQLIDEAEHRRLVANTAAAFDSVLRRESGYPRTYNAEFQQAFALYRYGVKTAAISALRGILNEVMPDCLEEIDRKCPGSQYQWRFWTALSDVLSAAG